MVVPWSFAVVFECFLYAGLVIFGLKKTWNIPEKKPHRANEIFYAILFIIFGCVSPFLFYGDNLPFELENRLYMTLYLVYLTLDCFWMVGNFLPNIIRCRKNPELKESLGIEPFLAFIKANHIDTVKRDLSRKMLHVIMWCIVVLLYTWAFFNQTLVEDTWAFTNYWAFTKFCWTLIAYGITFMFTLGDFVRISYHHWLPNWARKWYRTSIAPREAYTYISSIPYVLTLSLFQFAPIQVIFIATGVSTYADSAASIIGKSMGKHKFPAKTIFGKADTKKSYEGLLAGSFAAFLSAALTLSLFPVPNQNLGLLMGIGTVCMLLFASIDFFITKVADNITNVLFPGLMVWLMLAAFSVM
jgi:dolichol kinase